MTTRRLLTPLLLLPLLACSWSCGTGGLGGGPSPSEIDQAVARVYPALVRIDVVSVEGEAGRMRKGAGAGSGAIISPEGYIVTNHHVAGRAVQIRCRLSDGREVPARLVGTDALADVAVIQLDRSAWSDQSPPLAVAQFGDSDQLRVGDTVLAMGSPMAVSQSVTKGIVSNTQMIMPDLMWFATFSLDGENVGSLVRWIGHDAVIYGGNSGGPLVDLRGQIVGINEIGLGSLGGAIPSNLARDVAWQLIRTGAV